jgi:transcriptional regulator with XRE-family HTH domain
MKKLSKNLFTLRKLQGWSRREIAEQLGIPTSTYQSYEDDRADPNIELLIKLSDLHNVTIDKLVRENIKIGIK